MAEIRNIGDRYSSDRAQADRSLKTQAEFVLRNVRALRKKDRKGKKAAEVERILGKLENGFSPVDWERRIVDEAYEMIMKVVGLGGAEVHEDRRRKGLRYGHQ